MVSPTSPLLPIAIRHPAPLLPPGALRLPRTPALSHAVFGVAGAAYIAALLAADHYATYPQQLALGGLTWLVLFAWLARIPVLRRAQAIGVIVFATIGEVTGSLIWGLYSYRLHNLPLFVPPAHGLVFLTGVSIAYAMARHARLLVAAAAVAAVSWGVLGLLAIPRRDVAGALGIPLLLLFFWRSRARAVYAGVFLVVAALEFYGTAIGTWQWAAEVPGLGIPDGNPPSGVASGYIWFDVMALLVVPLIVPLVSFRARRTPTAAEQPRPTIHSRVIADPEARRADLGQTRTEPPAEQREPSRCHIGMRNEQHAAGKACQLEQVIRADSGLPRECPGKGCGPRVLNACGARVARVCTRERVDEVVARARQRPASLDHTDAVALGQIDDAELARERFGRDAGKRHHRVADRGPRHGDGCGANRLEQLQLVRELLGAACRLDGSEGCAGSSVEGVVVGGHRVVIGAEDDDHVGDDRHDRGAACVVGAEHEPAVGVAEADRPPGPQCLCERRLVVE